MPMVKLTERQIEADIKKFRVELEAVETKALSAKEKEQALNAALKNRENFLRKNKVYRS